MWNNDQDIENRIKPLVPNWAVALFTVAVFSAGVVGLIATIISFIGE